MHADVARPIAPTAGRRWDQSSTYSMTHGARAAVPLGEFRGISLPSSAFIRAAHDVAASLLRQAGCVQPKKRVPACAPGHRHSARFDSRTHNPSQVTPFGEMLRRTSLKSTDAGNLQHRGSLAFLFMTLFRPCL